MSVPNFYAILELHCLSSRMFFTLVGELELAVHEMWEVLKLSTGFLSSEEYFPCTAELEQLKTQDQALFETYRELMWHYYICLDVHNNCGNVNGLKSWGDYLCPSLEGAPEEAQVPVPDVDIETMTVLSGYATSPWRRTIGYTRKAKNSKASTVNRISPRLDRPY